MTSCASSPGITIDQRSNQNHGSGRFQAKSPVARFTKAVSSPGAHRGVEDALAIAIPGNDKGASMVFSKFPAFANLCGFNGRNSHGLR
jgi:hypothetical protein